MLFNSFNFLGFFALIALAYYALPHRFRWVLLLVASYYFYSTFAVEYLLLLGFATLVAYGGGRAIAVSTAKKPLLIVGIVAEIAALFTFKYFDFFAGSFEDLLGGFSQSVALPRLQFLLPVGLSFYTFSCVSYLIDIYRGTLPPERHLGKFALYVAFFPKLLAGPIERAPPFLAQLATPVRYNAAGVAVGLQLMVWGLFKKIVIADRLATFVDSGFTNPAFQSPVTVLVAAYFYAFQIYCDFSGYSDIAIGAALVLGIRLMENFRRPYLARSVPEFWNSRWHLSLTRWFRDYLYIPLGGSRVSPPRRYLNVMIVFLVSGLWHGANWTFVIWGGLNGLYQVIHAALAAPRRWLAGHIRLPKPISTILAILLTFHLIGIAWVFFRASSLSSALNVLSKIGNAIPHLPKLIASYHWSGEFYLALSLIVILMTVEIFDEIKPVSQRLLAIPSPVRWACYYAVIFSILVVGMWGTSGFVYMKF